MCLRHRHVVEGKVVQRCTRPESYQYTMPATGADAGGEAAAGPAPRGSVMASSVSRYAPNSRYSARGEGLQAVPADVQAIADTLRTLDLSANELQALSLPALLPVLEELLLADNLLDAPTLQRLRPALPATLRVLDLTANRLVAFPPLLLRLGQLAVLRVARQQLRALPSALSALVSLEELDASYNSLGSALQLDAPGLPRLRRLLLSGNCLTTLRLDPECVPRPG